MTTKEGITRLGFVWVSRPCAAEYDLNLVWTGAWVSRLSVRNDECAMPPAAGFHQAGMRRAATGP